VNSFQKLIRRAGPIAYLRLPDELEPEKCFSVLRRLKHCTWLDSAMQESRLGRYSYLACDPFDWIELTLEQLAGMPQAKAFQILRERIGRFDCQAIDGLPPFQGGAIGVLGYELNQNLESIPPTPKADLPTSPLAIGLYDVIFAWDHQTQFGWMMSSGFPALENEERSKRAVDRLEQFWRVVVDSECPKSVGFESCIEWTDHTHSTHRMTDVVEQFPVESLKGISSDFSKQDYLNAVSKCIDYIANGDIFQVNLSQRLLARASAAAGELYLELRACNPAPYAGFFDMGGSQVVSASPEQFLSVYGRNVETRPIKGTRRRTRFPEADLPLGLQLQSSVKDRAENIMIVDLLRNDLSRVCKDDSVKVTQLCDVEGFQSVLHLVSAIEGELRERQDVFDLLVATFPGGSITGAPKIRAMEIISELEPTARGPYCGSLGYIGFNGNAQFNILIRTITATEGWWQIPVGGGIVSKSDPHGEYEETWTKAASLLRAIATVSGEAKTRPAKPVSSRT